MGLASVTESDFLVIGGGSAGCIVAKRLAERTTGRTILLEAGKSDEGDAAATNLPRLDEQTEAYDWASGLRHSQTADPNWIVPAPDFWGALLTTMSAPSCGHPIRISMRGRIGVQQAGGCGYGPLFQPSHAKRRGRGSPTSFRQCSLRKGRQRAWPAGNRFQKQIAEGVGYFALNARGLAAVLIHHLPASSFRLATPSGDLDRGTGHANPDRER